MQIALHPNVCLWVQYDITPHPPEVARKPLSGPLAVFMPAANIFYPRELPENQTSAPAFFSTHSEMINAARFECVRLCFRASTFRASKTSSVTRTPIVLISRTRSSFGFLVRGLRGFFPFSMSFAPSIKSE